MFCYAADQFVFGLVAGYAFDRLSVFEQDERWDAHDAILHEHVGVLICVAFDDFSFSFPFFMKLVNNGGNHFAWAAPYGGEVNQYGECRL